MEKRINVTTTAYDGDDFPEAEHYAEWLAKRLATMYPGYEIGVSTGLASKAHVSGGDASEEEITNQIKVDLWEEFCDRGFKDYGQGDASSGAG